MDRNEILIKRKPGVKPKLWKNRPYGSFSILKHFQTNMNCVSNKCHNIVYSN